MRSPSLVTAKSFNPRSTPTALPVSGSGSGSGSAVSTQKVTYQRPSVSRETMTIVGFNAVTSTSPQDHTNSSGVLVLANVSWPWRMRNADRV